MISETKLEALAKARLPVLVVGDDRRQLLAMARRIHRHSLHQEGPFVIHRCGLPFWQSPSESEELSRLCASIFHQSSGGTLYFEGVDQLSEEEHQQLYISLERNEFWDSEANLMQPVGFRIVASAPPSILDLAHASNLIYRLARVVIRVP